MKRRLADVIANANVDELRAVVWKVVTNFLEAGIYDDRCSAGEAGVSRVGLTEEVADHKVGAAIAADV